MRRHVSARGGREWFGIGRRSVAASLVALTLTASACGDDDDASPTAAPATSAPSDPVADAEALVADAESGVADAQETLERTGEQFCVDAEGYLDVLDRYGKAVHR
jgi:hypothetical protein